MQTALVTGSNGFIGSHLVQWLQAQGRPVYAMVRKSSKLDNFEGSTPDFRYAGLDDVESLTAALSGIDTVYHLAGAVSGRTEEFLLSVNRDGTKNLFEAARKAKNGPRRVVVVSSLAASGPSHPSGPRGEHHGPSPISAYGRSKYAGEQAAYGAAKEGDIEVVIVRPPIVYGPRDDDFLQVLELAKWRIALTLGRSDQYFSAIESDDLVRGIVLAGDKGRPIPSNQPHALAGDGLAPDGEHGAHDHPVGNGIYFITDGARYTFAGLGQKSAEAMGKRAVAIRVPTPIARVLAAGSEWLGNLRGITPIFNRDKVREGSASGWWATPERARRELGYTPEVPFEVGVEKMIRWARDRGKL
jgi:nucleoside-diphosphate-sugar epimerase